MTTLLGYSPSTVYKPFQEEILTGNSSFTVTLPRHYASASLHANGEIKKRDFYFSEFNVVPSFYSQRAAQLGLDVEAEQTATVTLDLRFSFVFNKENMYKIQDTGADIKWEAKSRMFRIDRALENLNEFFDLHKPESVPQSPLFFDWIDTEWPVADEPAKVIPHVLHDYYEDADEEAPFDYIDVLPKSVRLVAGVNNYKFPTSALESQHLLDRLRIRIHLAPLTKILLSTDGMIHQLGFRGNYVRGEHNKIVFENPSAVEYLTLVAPSEPFPHVLGTSTTLILKGTADRSESTFRQIQMTMAVFMHNEELAATLKREFDSLSRETNVYMNLQYVPGESKFKIVFPANHNIVANVHCDIELAERLGFGLLTRISQNMTSIPIGEQSLAVDAENKSRALAFNTGMLFATLDGATGRQTDGLAEPLLATLVPTESGTFAVKANSMLRSFQLSTPSLSGHGHFPVKVNLWTLINGSKKVPLDWKIDVTANGVLEGI